MKIEDFKIDLESKLAQAFNFKQVDFKFDPSDLGLGIITYNIEGKLFRFLYHGEKEQIKIQIKENNSPWIFWGNDYKTISSLEGFEHNPEVYKKIISLADAPFQNPIKRYYLNSFDGEIADSTLFLNKLVVLIMILAMLVFGLKSILDNYN